MLCPAGFRVGCDDGRAAGQRDRFEAIAQNRNEDLHGTQSVTGEVKKHTHIHAQELFRIPSSRFGLVQI